MRALASTCTIADGMCNLSLEINVEYFNQTAVERGAVKYIIQRVYIFVLIKSVRVKFIFEFVGINFS